MGGLWRVIPTGITRGAIRASQSAATFPLLKIATSWQRVREKAGHSATNYLLDGGRLTKGEHSATYASMSDDHRPLVVCRCTFPNKPPGILTKLTKGLLSVLSVRPSPLPKSQYRANLLVLSGFTRVPSMNTPLTDVRRCVRWTRQDAGDLPAVAALQQCCLSQSDRPSRDAGCLAR